MNPLKILKNGVWDENPTFIQVIGTCPTLAVSTTAINGVGMGAAATFVLVGSNVVISLIRKFIPEKVRIPCFIVVIASFVTIVEFLLKAYQPELNKALGVFVPLIVVNCIILARAEAFAFKNTVAASALDGLGMGLGFTIALTVLGSIRELIGSGSIFGAALLPDGFPRTVLFILPPGAFITYGCLIALVNFIRSRGKGGSRQ